MTDVSGYCPITGSSVFIERIDGEKSHAEVLGESRAGLGDVVGVDSTVDERLHQLGVAVCGRNIAFGSNDTIPHVISTIRCEREGKEEGRTIDDKRDRATCRTS